MKKGSFITLLICVALIVLTGVLFGTVFCLRSQTVTILGESVVDISREEIISTAGLKSGESIFMIDKETAINNIEKKYANIKVVQIKTTSLTSVEIRIRARHEMFYAEFNNHYYLLDEELKVLNIIAKSEGEETSNKPTNLTLITSGDLSINTSTLKCDFVGSLNQQKTAKELYEAVINNVKNKTDDVVEYYTRADMCDIIKEIDFVQHNTFNKIILKTKYGVELDIENPTRDLTAKINICLSTIKSFLESEKDEIKKQAESGTIKIYYDLNNQQINVYIPNQIQSNE